MRFAVFGATGGTGVHVVSQALAAGHHVTALAHHEATNDAFVRQASRIAA